MKKLLWVMMLIVLCSFASADYVDDMDSQSVAYYKLEETAQPYVDEVTSLDLTSGTDPDRVAGTIDYGQDFDSASTEVIYTANNENFEQDYFVSSMWYTHTATTTAQSLYDVGETGGSVSGYGYLVQRSDHGTHPNEGYLYIYTVGGGLGDYTGKTWGTGEYAHVFQYYNGTHLVEMINCTETYSTSAGASTIVYPAGTDTGLTLGDRQNVAGFDGFNLNGELDEVWIGSGTFTNYTEVCEFLFNSGSPDSDQQYVFVGVAVDVIANITDINCTSPEPDDTTEPFWTNDDTPTYSITTDNDADCKINGSTVCATTGAKHHICTQPSALDEGLVDIYLSCNSTTGNVSTFSYQNYIDTIDPNGTITSPTASQQYNQTILSTITISVVFEDRTDVNNISCLINGTTNATNSSPINNTVWNWEFTPSAFTDYVVDCYAWDNVSTYNQGSTGLTAFSFIFDVSLINYTYGTNIIGPNFLINWSKVDWTTLTVTDYNQSVTNQTITNAFVSVCNDGTKAGELVMWINETSDNHTFKCNTTWNPSSLALSDSYNITLNSSIVNGSCNSVYCWLDWENASLLDNYQFNWSMGVI